MIIIAINKGWVFLVGFLMWIITVILCLMASTRDPGIIPKYKKNDKGIIEKHIPLKDEESGS